MKRIAAVLAAGLVISFTAGAFGNDQAPDAAGIPEPAQNISPSSGPQITTLFFSGADDLILARRGGGEHEEDEGETHHGGPATPVAPSKLSSYEPGDPRQDGLEVVLGEWAVTLEADVIRPGPVTFIVKNKGTKSHGFRIRTVGQGKARFEARSELVPPGDETLLSVNLGPRPYRVDCFVVEPGIGSHEEMGMRATLTVRDDAPLTSNKAPSTAQGTAVSMENFTFKPSTITVTAGSTVVWKNNDPTPHTVTAHDGSFDSGVLEPGAEFKKTFSAAGTFPYKCTIHPSMTGKVVVQGK